MTRRHLSCLKPLTRNIRTQTRYNYDDGNDSSGTRPSYTRPANLATPRQLTRYLDEYVVGQETAKKVLSVAVFNHYNRVHANLISSLEEQDPGPRWANHTPDEIRNGVASAEIHPHPYRLPHATDPVQPRKQAALFEKSNVLVIGPTGSGKTLLARTLARVLDVPFASCDATSFTQAGYVGDDVDVCIQRLLQDANWDPYRASTGIVYIDEIDKIARKSGGHGTESTRDVGGEGVQQALLRMMEGSVINVASKGAPPMGPPAGQGRARGSQQNLMAIPRPESYAIDTSNVLFVLSGAFVGLDTIIKRRITKGSIGFTATIISESETQESNSSMPFFTPNKGTIPNPLDRVEPSDLVKYGFIPEFVSRLPSLTTLSPLSISDLRRVLTEVRGSLVSQYTALFGYSGVEIRFTSAAIDEICRKAAERGGGARGLRGIMESILLDAMYEVPGSNIRHVLITHEVVRGDREAIYWTQGDATSFWAAWTAEEDRYASSQL